jgi:hypothetical protein
MFKLYERIKERTAQNMVVQNGMQYTPAESPDVGRTKIRWGRYNLKQNGTDDDDDDNNNKEADERQDTDFIPCLIMSIYY